MSTEAPRQSPAALERQGGVVAGMTLLSRLSGFLRDVVVSNLIGAGAQADAFFVAFRIPNFFRRLFAEGAFSQAFVPVLADYRAGSRTALRRFVQIMAGNLALAVCLLTVIGILLAPAVVLVFAPGYAGEAAQLAHTAELLRITFPYLAFIALTAFAGSVLNAHGQFAVPAFTPVLLNLALIGAAVTATLGLAEPTLALAWGVFVAGAVQLLFQTPSLRRLELLARPHVDFRDPGARQVGGLLVPAVLAASAGQINALVDTMLASTLERGSISWLYYADRLLELPVGLVAVALGTVLLPNLSRLHGAGQHEDFAATLDWGLRVALLLGVPAAAALWWLALPLIGSIFGHGAMQWRDVVMAANALMAFAPGLLGILLVKVLAPGFFARKDTRTPLRCAFAAVVVNVLLNLLLIGPLAHVGLALATSVAALVNGTLLLVALIRSGGYRPGAAVVATLARVLLAALLMLLVLWWWVPPVDWWREASLAGRWWQLLGAVLIGGATYVGALGLLGVRPGALRHRA